MIIKYCNVRVEPRKPMKRLLWKPKQEIITVAEASVIAAEEVRCSLSLHIFGIYANTER